MIRRCDFCHKLMWPWTEIRTSVIAMQTRHNVIDGKVLYFHAHRCWMAYHSRQWNLRQAEKARL